MHFGMTGKMHKQQRVHGPVHHFVHALQGRRGGGGGGVEYIHLILMQINKCAPSIRQMIRTFSYLNYFHDVVNSLFYLLQKSILSNKE